MIIGTAGHIDHGKTSLVKALTGVNADRLKEEKARGITIDLGYAYAALPDGDVLGFVDVPGHEKLVHNMLAGATGIDFVLLVIAADDGPMPQTREHLAIANLLGLTRGVVALTKTDRVAPERVAHAISEIQLLLSGTGLENSPIFPLSTISGQGVSELRAHMERMAGEVTARQNSGHFRLAVDRSFTLDGTGVVVTGTAMSGEVHVGDKLRVSPSGLEVRVRGIHAQNRPSDACRAGQRCALNLSGAHVEKNAIRRGDWVLEAPIHEPILRFDGHLQLLPSEQKPLKHRSPVHLHIGASDIVARIAVLEGMAIEPGDAAFVQIIADKPVCALHGDRFILRDQSATRTIGGGRVLDPFPPATKRRTPMRLALLRSMQEIDPGKALMLTVEGAPAGVDLIRFCQSRNIQQENGQMLWQTLPMHAIATPSAVLGFSPVHWKDLKHAVLNRLSLEHEQAQDSLGPDRARLHRMALPFLVRPAFSVLIDEMLSAGQIAQSGPWLHLPDHRVTLAPAELSLWQTIQPMLETEPFQPPRVRDIAQTLALNENRVRSLLRRVTRVGEVYLVAHDHYFTKDAVAQLSLIVSQLAETHGGARAAEFRDCAGIGRKLAVQILEFFDRIGYTRRTGDNHRLRQESVIRL